MKPTSPSLETTQKNGFALIATISVMVLLVMIALAMLSLSTIELRQTRHATYQQQAQENARMALMIAIGELQKYAGPDQRITANASILDTKPDTEEIDGVENPNLLGVWKNADEDGNFMIGKDSSKGGESIYGTRDYYKDLRFSNEEYKDGKWKEKLHLTWLASFRPDKSSNGFDAYKRPLNPDDEDVVALLSKGTLGKSMTKEEEKEERILVQKIDIKNKGGTVGSYAWAVMDNNQKSAITLANSTITDNLKLAAAQNDKYSEFGDEYETFDEDLALSGKDIISYKNISFLGKNSKDLSLALGRDFNHFTANATGLFTNPIDGGLKKDLTPLLFGDKDKSTVEYATPSTTTATHDFSSSYPIIPGPRHLSHGPSFDALRYWGKQKYTQDLASGAVEAETRADNASLRMRPTGTDQGWRFEQNDGSTFNAKDWASKYPKIIPVMTEARFHYYFGLTPDGKSIQTHIIPRVCLWNPYSVPLKTSEMAVLMPNFFKKSGFMKFRLSDEESNRLEALAKTGSFPVIGGPPGRNSIWDFLHLFYYAGPDVADPDKSGLFPRERFLGFILEPTTIPPGECLVFSATPQLEKISRGGVTIGKYDPTDIAQNRLSASSKPGEEHFIHDTESFPLYKNRIPDDDPNSSDYNPRFTELLISKINLREVEKYEPDMRVNHNFCFVLKSGNGPSFSGKTTQQISESPDYPTLQLVNGSTGGSQTAHDNPMYEKHIGDSERDGFGYLETFTENPQKKAPNLHQIGTKLLWFDESKTEGNSPPYRAFAWHGEKHLGYNPAIIANWNVRAQLSTRSPASPSYPRSWATYSSGAWIVSFVPPQVNDDMPVFVDGNFTKFPFGSVSDFRSITSASLFDLPNTEYGALSLAKLSHAQLSPYSWSPTYVIGSSLPDLHAPLDATAHPLAAATKDMADLASQWDMLIGGYCYKTTLTDPEKPFGIYGLKIESPNLPTSDGLLQIGDEALDVAVDGSKLSTKDEMLAYDIAYETNQNLWDRFFLSGLQLKSDGSAFISNALNPEKLWNQRYTQNKNTLESTDSLNKQLEGSEGMAFAFWNAAYILKNKAAFNVNSTSISAWTAFLSGIRNVKRPLADSGFSGGEGESVFSRLDKPKDASKTSKDDPSKNSALWGGGRILKDDEIKKLATAIVREVKYRGPFISLSDMINRRLMPLDQQSKADPRAQRGAIEAAIQNEELNSNFEEGVWERSKNSESENENGEEKSGNRSEFTLDYDHYLDKSKAWGAPGFLTQTDLLEPLAPSMMVRGDTFTIRCYGEAKEGDIIKARAYLEAVVVRMPDYMESESITSTSKTGTGNLPTDPARKLDYATGMFTDGELTKLNKTFGRKFKILSFRWLSPSEL